jgi:hypothetical protein
MELNDLDILFPVLEIDKNCVLKEALSTGIPIPYDIGKVLAVNRGPKASMS